MDTFLGYKVKKDQDYNEAGFRVPVTFIRGKLASPAGGLDQSVKLDHFAPGDKVKVTGTSKGKGFAGVVKRHGFKGGPKTHGQSDRERAPGAIGSTTTPGRVYRGKRMAGHMGNVKRTVLGLSIFAVKPEENLLVVKGLIPGNRNGLVKVIKY